MKAARNQKQLKGETQMNSIPTHQNSRTRFVNEHAASIVTAAATTAALILTGSPVPAHADVKIVSEVSVSGMNSNGGPGNNGGGPNGGNRRANGAGAQGGNAGNFGGGSGGQGGPGGFGGGPNGGGGRMGRGGPGGPLLSGLKNGKQTVTTYFKGSKARRETSGGAVVIYDRSTDKIYTLDAAAKTYSVLSFADTLNRGAKLPEPMQQFMSQNATFELKTSTGDTTQNVQVAQRSAQSYNHSGQPFHGSPKAA